MHVRYTQAMLNINVVVGRWLDGYSMDIFYVGEHGDSEPTQRGV